MYNLNFYHGTISISETERRLRQLDLVGSYFLRCEKWRKVCDRELP